MFQTRPDGLGVRGGDVALAPPKPAPKLPRCVAAPVQVASPDALKILILEDNPNDADLMQRALCKTGLNFTARRVDSRAAFIAALETFAPDILLADYSLPAFNGGEALAHVRHVHPEIPVVVVTGALCDEAAIELLHAGAADYVLKSNLLRLSPAVGRAISVERGIRARKAAEGALRGSNALLQTTERIAHIGGFDWDIAGGRILWSEETYRMFGLVPGEFVPTIPRFVECIHPDDRGRMQEAIDASVTRSQPFDIEFRILRPDKAERIIKSRGEIIRDKAGKPARLTGTSLDITERKRAAEGLRASEERFRLVVEHAPDAILLYDADREHLIAANKAAERLFGFPRDQIIEQGPQHFYVPEQPDARPVEQSFGDHTKRALAGEELTYERQILNASGQERLCQVTLVRMPSPDQRLLRASFVDITDRKAAEQALHRLNRTLRTLSSGNEALVRATSEPELLEETCRVIVETGGYRMAWIGIAQHDVAKLITPAAWAGEIGHYLKNARITWADERRGRGPHGRAIRTGEPQVTQNLRTDPTMAPWQEAARKSGFESSAVLPLKDASGVFALLAIHSAEADAFDADELKLLQELASDLAFGIRGLREQVARKALDKRWRTSLEATIGAIANTVEMRDPYTAGHQQRVAKLAVAIARELHLPEQQIEGLYLAGIVHDVGKIDVPAEILNKPGKLSKLQYQLIQAHAEAGYDIIKGVDFPWPIAGIVRQHHERLDGSGYPHGLAGEAILPEAKILAVADVVESMMSHRPYRASLGIEAALAEIEADKGRLFDAAAVEACTALFRENRFTFE
ncbi:MAG: HD domain-containing phosphohydrolase [Stellaceae bacterium]